MRTRTKYDGPDYKGVTSYEGRSATRSGPSSPWSGFSAWGTLSNPDRLLLDGESVITDDITPSKGVKTVTHTKRKFSLVAIPSYDEYTDTNRYQAVGPYVHQVSWGVYGKVLHSYLSASYPKTVDQLKVEAMHKFHYTNEVNTLLNVLEAPQLITSARQLIKLMSIHGKKRRSGKRENSLPSIASSGFLGWSFGVAPLISDFTKVNRALAGLKAATDRYIREGTKRYVVTCRSTGSLSLNVPAGLGYSPNANNNDSSVWHAGIYPTSMPVRIVGASGIKKVLYHSDTLNRIDYVMKRFIATGPAALAWERIPFSFVVDWFVNLSGIIDSLDASLLGDSSRLDTVWTSEKWAALIPVYKHKYAGWTSDSDGKQTAQNELSYYHREAISTSPTVTLSGRFGKKQLALTAALLHQIVANLRVWR